MDATLISLGTGSLICLMPLGLYLLYLSYLNGRVPPTLVRGPWDFASLLLGLSGFLLLSGPLVLTLVDSTWRSYAFGNWAELKGVGIREARAWSFMATGWFFMWLGIIPLLLRARRHVTAAYNIVPALMETQFIQTLEDLGYPWRRVGNELEIDVNKHDAVERPATRFAHEQTAYVRIMLVPSTSHAMIRWSGATDRIREEIEAVLPNILARGLRQRNPVAGWMFVAAVVVMIIMLVWMAILMMVIMMPQS